jgi:hypothetical protein
MGGGSLNLVGQGGGVINSAALVKVAGGGNLALADKAVIRDNYNDSGGGGVAIGGTFDKTGGIIYGDDDIYPDNGNETDNTCTAVVGGHAVWVGNSNYTSTLKKRDSTVGTGEELHYNGSGATGDWDEP